MANRMTVLLAGIVVPLMAVSLAAQSDRISGVWASDGRPLLELEAERDAVSGTVHFYQGSTRRASAPIESGSFDGRTGALRLTGVVTPPDGRRVRYVIEGTLQQGVLQATVLIDGVERGSEGLRRLDGSTSARTQKWTQGRTPDGQPDIQGIWVNFDSTPFEAPAPIPASARPGGPAANVGPAPEFAVHDSPTSAARRSMVVDPPEGRVPVLKWAEDKRDYDLAHIPDAPEHETPWVRCITRGHPAGMFPAGYNNAYEIIQIPGYVVIVSEMIHETRIIPIDGRRPLGEKIRHWNGEPRGRWEGNTLVVESTNYNDKGSIATSAATGRMRGIPQTEAMRVVERFTRSDDTTIQYSVTIDDPKVYTRPWTVAMPLNRDDNYQMLEYSCHEGNYALPNALSAGRVRDAASSR